METAESIVEKVRAKNDQAWKQVLKDYFKDFVEFFWPQAYQAIDWSRNHEALEQELLVIGVQEAIGNLNIDKLFKVFLNTGQEQWLLLHIEVQHSKENNFSARMFTYFYRIYDRYKQDVASMAILVDKNKMWRPTQYYRKIWGSEIKRTYEVIKLIDFKPKISELRNSTNPFALVVACQLAALETSSDNKARLLTKLELFRCLLKHGWSAEKSMDLYRFLDTILVLPPKFEVQCVAAAKQIDKESNMKLMSSIEREGYDRGIHQGERTLLECLLLDKFGSIPASYQKQIARADADKLLVWGRRVLNSNTLAEVFMV